MTTVLLIMPLVEPLEAGEGVPTPLIQPGLWVPSGSGTVVIDPDSGGIDISSSGTQTKVTHPVQTQASWTYRWTYRVESGTGQRAVGTLSSAADVSPAVTTPGPSLVTVDFVGTGGIFYLQLYRSSSGSFIIRDITLEESPPVVVKVYVTDEAGNYLTNEADERIYIDG